MVYNYSMDYKPLPIGIDNFELLITKGYYYVDKTLLIKKLLDGASMVSLFTRPRRFGKSLNLSMLQYYFEKTEADRKTLFEGLAISNAGEKYTAHKGCYPVIMLNFKEATQDDFETSYARLRRNIAKEFSRHSQMLSMDVLTAKEMQKYQSLQDEEADIATYIDSVTFLSECLERTYNEKVIILIDEYDVPLENAYYKKFYDRMVSFIRGVLSAALKTNNSLAFAVMTGCLRISKESIFTGLNNLEIISIQNKGYGEYFGFTNDEVMAMLIYYNKSHHMQTIKDWYNGYIFGTTEVYNPWSLVTYVKSLLENDTEHPAPFWSNTNSNSIVRDLIKMADSATKAELEILSSGGTIEKPIREDISYQDIYTTSDNLWNFLYFTGYLRKVNERFEGHTSYVTMRIPNEEVAYIYENTILEWSKEQLKKQKITRLYEATLAGDTETMQKEINSALMATISYLDSSEAFYHGLMSGMYNRMEGYSAVSNMEVGDGRPDFVIMDLDTDGKAVIMEFKNAKNPSQMGKLAEAALEQIKIMRYKEGLEASRFYKDITVYGICFCAKKCLVKKG